MPYWSLLPFIALLGAIAVLPQLIPSWWEHAKNRATLTAVLASPVVLWLGVHQPQVLWRTCHEYVAFAVLLASLYIIASGIVVRGGPRATPAFNTALLLGGAVLASAVGTTGATMLLIRPLLRANAHRRRVEHVVIFFIFCVGNVGGLLTPLGDPPLFLGFLRGVPFAWTLGLWREWGCALLCLAAIFYVLDRTVTRQEPSALPTVAAPLSLLGLRNVVWLVGILLVILVSGSYPMPVGTAELGMAALAAAAWWATPTQWRRENGFSWEPITEVAILFAGIFATMQPALMLLQERGEAIGISQPWQFFWLTGLLSSILDNAPTYLTFTAAASVLQHTNAETLQQLIATERGDALLRAISVGAVMMGANTYLGNGPNFMVKAVAEQNGVKMPGFLGYMAYSGAVLLPLFGILTWMFFT